MEMLNMGQINWLLLLVVVILLFYTVKGSSDGFILTIFEMFSVLAAAAAASFAAPHVNALLKKDAPLFAFLAVFLVFWLLLQFICTTLNLISKLPVINELNKAAGILAGLFHGIITVWILFIVITVFHMTSWGSMAMELIQESRLLKELYQSNLILKLAEMFF